MFSLILKTSKSFLRNYGLIAGLLLLSGLAHGYNLFHFPYFENDEATYVSQAWSTISEGKLAPYTYYYDHSPAGWILLGIWFKLTGGLTTFDPNPLISGRIFIFVLHLVSVSLLFSITKRITRQTIAAIFAVLVFSLSPLELYYGRRILLDNIMVFWMLLSLYYATFSASKIRHTALSALTFGIAVLSKENAIFFGPVILYIVNMYSPRHIKNWTSSVWITIAGSTIAIYPAYALLKNEFFSGNNHVSLIDTLILQAKRGRGGLPWQPGSDFYSNLIVWMDKDPWIISLGTLSLMFSMALNQKYKEIKAIGLTAIAQLLFFTRGSLVYDFYILSVLPLLAMSIAIMLAQPLIWAKNHISPWGYSFITSLVIIIIFLTSGTPAFIRDETTNQTLAIDWVIKNIPKTAKLAVNNYAYPQLKYVEGFNQVDFSFKLQFDPEIQQQAYQSNPMLIDYILLSHEEIIHMQQGNIPFIKKAFDNSQLIADFRKTSTSYIDTDKLISTNGDWAQVYAIDNPKVPFSTHLWREYKKKFITDNGQVIDLSNWTTTSEGQSYALLRAIEQNDPTTFDLVWQWTSQNLQVRPSDSLFSWRINLDEQGNNHLNDINAAADADLDIAHALLKASAKWQQESYSEAALFIIQDIWNYEVVNRNNTYFLISAPDKSNGRRLLVNPSYFSPAYYKEFAQIDPTHDWIQLVDDTYKLIDQIQALSPAKLISNWIFVEPNNSLSSASSLITQGADQYGFDAFRFTWRMYQDLPDPRAEANLQELSQFYSTSWKNHQSISAIYDLLGNPASEYSSPSTSAGAVIALTATKSPLALTIYDAEIIPQIDQSTYVWKDPTNYYNQNWVAFAQSVIELESDQNINP